jgi:hypothetical protein
MIELQDFARALSSQHGNRPTHECLIPAAIFATVQATDEAAKEPDDSAATDTAVHPITAAINTENSRFSEIRL